LGSSGSGSSDPTAGNHLDTGLIAGLSVAFGLLTMIGLLGAFAVWRKLLSKKSAKEVESDGEEGDDHHPVATDPAPVVRVGQRPPAAALPPVQEEMAETPRDHAPQLAPLSVTEREHSEGTGHWPLEQSSSSSAAPPRDIHHGSTRESQPAMDKGKGKEIASDEDH
jgi:hypothetical protein